MKVDFSVVLVDSDDQPFPKTEVGGKELDFTAARAVVKALTEADPRASGEKKFERYELSLKIKANPASVDLKAEEAADIKKVLGEAYAAQIVGQIYHLIEGAGQELKS